MKKYTLFSEFLDKEIYGNDLADAIMHAGPLSSPFKWKDNKHIPGDIINVKKVLCHEKVDNSSRGDDAFERIIVEIDNKIRISIDGRPAAEGILSKDLDAPSS